MALLIPVMRENYASLVGALNTFARHDWAVRGQIHLFPLDQPLAQGANELTSFCQSNNIKTILVPQRVHCDSETLRDAGYDVLLGPNILELTQGFKLREYLREYGLDWRSEVLANLGNYGLGKVGEAEMDSWLGQFERLGNHKPVGEHLLQLLEVVSLADLGEALCADSDFYGTDLVVGFNNDKWGKSWGTVSNLMRKKCASASILPITEAIQVGGHPKVLKLVEDGLFSGTEIRAILDSLRGTRPPNRTPKVPQLPDPVMLSQAPTELRFSVVCDFGEAVLREYLSSSSLANIQVSVSTSKKIRVLLGVDSVENSDSKDRLLARVVPHAFQDDKGWKDSPKKLRAKVFCEQIGEQLWKNYLNTKENFDHQAWPEERIKRCALGMDGLGLTLAFPHSVPKLLCHCFGPKVKLS